MTIELGLMRAGMLVIGFLTQWLALRMASAKRELEPKLGWTVIALVPPTES